MLAVGAWCDGWWVTLIAPGIGACGALRASGRAGAQLASAVRLVVVAVLAEQVVVHRSGAVWVAVGGGVRRASAIHRALSGSRFPPRKQAGVAS